MLNKWLWFHDSEKINGIITLLCVFNYAAKLQNDFGFTKF